MALELDQVFVIEEGPEDALGAAYQKMDTARASGDERSRALCLIKAADALVQLGRVDEASGHLSEASWTCGEMKFEEGRAACMNVTAKVHTKKGGDEEELEEALDSANDALKLFRKLGFRKGEAAALTTLAGVYLASKKAVLAIKSAKEALAILAELGEKRAMAVVYDSVKAAYLAKSPPESFLAAKQVEKAVAIYKDLGDKAKEAAGMHSLAMVEKGAGDVKKAADALQKAKELFAEAGDTRGESLVLDTVMGMLVDGGLYFDAIKVGKQRIMLFHNSGDASEEARAMVALGDVMMKNDDHEKAAKLAENALGIFAGVNDMDGLKSAKEMLDGAKHAKAVEEIETSISKVSPGMHVPKTLLVDPGLNKRITGAWGTAITN